MKISLVSAGLLLSLLSVSVLADPHKDESGHGSKERAAYSEAHREYWKHQEERAREARKQQEETARERWKREEELFREERKREEEWLREERNRAPEWQRDHSHPY